MILSNLRWAILTFLKKGRLPRFFTLLFFLLAANNLFAAKYCLKNSSPSVKVAVENKLTPFLKRGERIDWEINCFELQVSEGRDMLLQRLLSEVTPFEVGSEVVVTRTPCELELIETTSGNSKGTRTEVSRQLDLRASKRSFSGETRSRLLLSSGRPGRIEAYNTALDLVCIPSLQGSAEVEVWLYSDGGRAQVSTTLTLTKGQAQFLGDVIKELEDKNRSVSLARGYQRTTEEMLKKTQFYLVLK